MRFVSHLIVLFGVSACSASPDDGQRFRRSKAVIESSKKLHEQAKVHLEAPPPDTLQPTECSGEKENVYCTPLSGFGIETMYNTIVAPGLKMGLTTALGSDIGAFWSAYLDRKYETHKFTGQKVKTFDDVDHTILAQSMHLVTRKIKQQFRADPESLYWNDLMVDHAYENAMGLVSCHMDRFPVEGPWFAIDFGHLIKDLDDQIEGKPPGYFDISFGGMDNTLYHAPSNLAGGVGGSDYGDDLRFFDGALHCKRDGVYALQCRSKVKLRVFDSIDFCPGQCGSSSEQIVTIPMSRFEATGLAYDLPFEVSVNLPIIEKNAAIPERSAEWCGKNFPVGSVSMDNVRFDGFEVVEETDDIESMHFWSAKEVERHREETNIYKHEGTLESVMNVVSKIPGL